MSKLYFSGTAIKTQAIPNMNRSIEVLQSAINSCSFSIPSGFSDGVLNSLSSDLTTIKNSMSELNEWLKKSVETYTTKIDDFCSDVSVLQKSDLKERNTIVI